MTSVDDVVLADDPTPGVRRLTLNRPAKRNAMNNELRRELFRLLREADRARDIRAIILRANGPAFCSGYDLGRGRDKPEEMSHHGAIVDGYWVRQALDGWFEMWDYATPVIAQVHGWCLAGGTELATACDLVYVAEDAVIGYPPVRLMSCPDMVWQPWLMGMRRAMEALLTGDGISGAESVTAGFANRAFPAEDLEAGVLAVAERIIKIPHDLLAINKRAVHRSMEAMGIRQGMRAVSDIQALGLRTKSSSEYLKRLSSDVSEALDHRDGPFGDYRASDAR
jgi:enoyl-CoA hydratase